MNADQERLLRAWLEARDPGDTPARLRAAVAQVPLAGRGAAPALDAALQRLFGPAASVRLALLLAALLILVVVAVGAVLMQRQPFPPRGFIAYAAQTGLSDIRLIAADGTDDRPVTETPDAHEIAPRWSPDGRTLLFIRIASLDGEAVCGTVEGSIVLYDLATGAQRDLASGLATVQAAEWSASGREIGFLQDAADCRTLERGEIEVASGRVTVTNIGGTAGPSLVPGGGRAIAKGLRWTGTSFEPVDPILGEVPSRDGRRVAVAPLARALDSQLVIVDRITGARVNLGPGSWPAWSPDDSSVAFVQPTNDGVELGVQYHDRLVVTEVDTGTARILGQVLVPAVFGGVEDGTPQLLWTPDGRAVYWVDGAGGHVVDVETGDAVELPAALKGCPDPQWQPLPRR
jgi:dipeptidyl aminopeptidase/acylaminoacyl peptidase